MDTSFLQLPGPTNIPRQVLDAFGRPPCDFADPQFIELVDSVFDRTARLFGAEAVCAYPSVGHGMWEAGLTNTVEPGARVAFVPTGAFSGFWADVVGRLGYDVVSSEAGGRRAPRIESLAELLADDRSHEIKAVCATHTETSTGVRSDIDAVRRALDEAAHPALLIVDGVASVGTEHVDLAEQRIDLLLAAGQKGLMMPPGLGLLLVGPKALAAGRAMSPPPYWDWRDRIDPIATYQRFGGTPLMQHTFAWEAALDLIEAEGGIDEVVDRHRRLSRAIHSGVAAWGHGFELYATEAAERANAVTAVIHPDLDVAALAATTRDRYSVAVGMWLLTDHAIGFRIGHLGAMNEAMLLGALGGIEMAFRSLRLAHNSGLGAAMDALADAPMERP